MLIDDCLCPNSRPVRLFSRNGVQLCECQCGMQWLRSGITPAEYSEQYRGAYHRAVDRHPGCVPYQERYEHDRRVARLRIERYAEILGPEGKGPGVEFYARLQALDVGAAAGAFVDELRAQGFDACGVDPDPAMTRPGIIFGTSADVGGKFDLMTYHDVLEHVLDPRAELARAHELLAESGVLIIDVPDVHAPNGAGEHHYKAEHPWYFTEAGLVALLQRGGFEPFHIERPIPGKLVVYARLQA